MHAVGMSPNAISMARMWTDYESSLPRLVPRAMPLEATAFKVPVIGQYTVTAGSELTVILTPDPKRALIVRSDNNTGASGNYGLQETLKLGVGYEGNTTQPESIFIPGDKTPGNFNWRSSFGQLFPGPQQFYHLNPSNNDSGSVHGETVSTVFNGPVLTSVDSGLGYNVLDLGTVQGTASVDVAFYTDMSIAGTNPTVNQDGVEVWASPILGGPYAQLGTQYVDSVGGAVLMDTGALSISGIRYIDVRYIANGIATAPGGRSVLSFTCQLQLDGVTLSGLVETIALDTGDVDAAWKSWAITAASLRMANTTDELHRGGNGVCGRFSASAFNVLAGAWPTQLDLSQNPKALCGSFRDGWFIPWVPGTIDDLSMVPVKGGAPRYENVCIGYVEAGPVDQQVQLISYFNLEVTSNSPFFTKDIQFADLMAYEGAVNWIALSQPKTGYPNDLHQFLQDSRARLIAFGAKAWPHVKEAVKVLGPIAAKAALALLL